VGRYEVMDKEKLFLLNFFNTLINGAFTLLEDREIAVY
jgi:hypothetical protein